MGTVYITCPNTQQAVRTGIQMTTEGFEMWTYSGAGAPCPHCRETHPWAKQDARLERHAER